MFRVAADSLDAYLDFDPVRKPDLVRLHELMRKTAPVLKRHFHKGTPAGEAGMRMQMIGYGKFRYAIKSGNRLSGSPSRKTTSASMCRSPGRARR